MREINLTFANFGNRVIPIGTAGENLAMQVKIDCSAPLAEHPGAHAALTVNPPSGGEYTGETWTDGTDVYWKVQNSDLLVPGRGNVVLSIIDNLGMILETAAAIIVIQDNNESGALPKWLDDLIAKALYLDSIAEPAAAGAVAAKLLAEAAATNAAASAADAAQYTAAAVATWLDAHPEATTTVQDGAITRAKLDADLQGKTDAVSDLKSAFREITGNELLTEWSANHKYINLGGSTANINSPTTTTSDVRYMVVPVSAGDVFTITATGGGNSRAYGFIASDGTILTKAGASIALSNLVISAVDGAAWLVVNDTTLEGTVFAGDLLQSRLDRDEKEIWHELDAYFPINLAKSVVVNNGSINHTDGRIISTSSLKHTPCIDISNAGAEIIYSRYTRTESGTSTSGMAFYSDTTVSSYISGQSIGGGADVEKFVLTKITVPDNAKYARFSLPANWEDDFAVYGAAQYVDSPVIKSDKTADDVESLTADVAALETTVSGIGDDVNAIESNLADITAEITALINSSTQVIAVDFSQYKQIGYYINASNKWAKNTAVGHKLIPVPKQTVSMHIAAQQDEATTYAFLTDGDHTGGTTPAFCEGTSRVILEANTYNDVPMPETAKYVYVYTKSSISGDVTPAAMSFSVIGGNQADKQEVAQELETLRSMIENQLWHQSDSERKDVPENKGVLNTIRKASQLTNIRWTPLAVVPRAGNEQFPANVEVRGVPYSSAKELMKYVGKQVSIRTFVTAVHNPYSLLYTENISAAHSASGYGFTYHGTNCSCYYGMVCSSLQSYSLGIDAYWDTYQFEYLASIGFFSKIYDQSADGVKLGDIYWKYGHTRIITAVTRNEYNEVTQIVMREAISPTQKTISYSANYFNSTLASEHGIIYRYSHIYQNLEYVPSPFIPVLNEQAEPYVYNDDICTYAGDYAAFRCGEPVWLNYTKGTYANVEIYKDDTLIETVALSADASIHKIEVTTYTATAGMYKARLTDGTNSSDYTYWQMIDVQVTCENNDGVLDVHFSASNATPQSCVLTKLAGDALVTYVFTATDIATGHAQFDAIALYGAQKGNYAFSEPTYLKVFFSGEYGTVINGLLDTGLYPDA